MKYRTKAILTAAAPVALIVAVMVALRPWGSPGGQLASFSARPKGIMGTDCLLTAVVAEGRGRLGRAALEAAEAELRRVEVMMSSHMEGSELWRFNAASPRSVVAVSPELMGLLRSARDLADRTDGAFDVTVGPLIRLWSAAGAEGRVPGDEQIDRARGQIGWDGIELREDGLRKLRAAARIDLGGIAKGYGIDRAVKVLQDHGCAGGLVDVGGDVRCFGARAGGGRWRIGVRDPFDPATDKLLAILEVAGGAVCTSGNYFRYSTIDGRRYSHIIDPRAGRPAEAAASVTVFAPTAVAADAWATALSVLGPDGLKLLAEHSGMEAMLVVGTAAEYSVIKTAKFDKLLKQTPARATEGYNRQ